MFSDNIRRGRLRRDSAALLEVTFERCEAKLHLHMPQYSGTTKASKTYLIKLTGVAGRAGIVFTLRIMSLIHENIENMFI